MSLVVREFSSLLGFASNMARRGFAFTAFFYRD
jgi:hypothetical protein